MPNERDKEKSARKEQATGGQQSHASEYGEQGRQTDSGEASQQSSGSMPPRSMGTKGTEFGQFGEDEDKGQQGQSGTGQADLGSQAATTLAGHTDQQDLGTDQPGRVGGAEGEGFILRQEDLVKKEGSSSAKATGGTEFARGGRGATEDEDEASSEGGTG